MSADDDQNPLRDRLRPRVDREGDRRALACSLPLRVRPVAFCLMMTGHTEQALDRDFPHQVAILISR